MRLMIAAERGRRGSRIVRCSLISLCAVAGIAAGGCDRGPRGQKYESLSGVVTERHPATGEISITYQPPGSDEPAVAACVMTRDSEIYINDRLSAIEDVRIGDAIAIVYYEESGPQLEQFIISYGRIRRATRPAGVNR